MTPEEIKELQASQEKVNKLLTDIQADLADAKAKKIEETPEFQEKLGKMVMAQLEKADIAKVLAAKIRQNGEFEDVEKNAIEFGHDAYPNKMMMPASRAKMHYGDGFGQKLAYLQELNDTFVFVKTAMAHKAAKAAMPLDIKSLNVYNEIQAFLKSNKDLQKALATSATNLGAEWIPTGFSSRLMEAVRLEAKVAGLFETISMPTNPYTIPVDLRGTGAYLVAENTSGSSPTKVTETGTANVTDNMTLTAKKIGARLVFSEEINEDSIVSLIPMFTNILTKDLAEGLEDAIINGDDNGTHMDSDITGTTSVKEAFDGLRYYALNNGTAAIAGGNGAPTIDMIRSQRAEMGKYGVNPKDLAVIAGMKVYMGLLGIDQVETLEKFGGQFTALSGALGVVDGMPVVVSEFARENLNASGVYDGSTTDRATMLIPNRKAFLIGNRSDIQINTLMDVEYDQIIMVPKMRVAFQNIYGAAADAVSITVNLDA